MRKTGGYMTVEISALLPIILMVLWIRGTEKDLVSKNQKDMSMLV